MSTCTGVITCTSGSGRAVCVACRARLDPVPDEQAEGGDRGRREDVEDSSCACAHGPVGVNSVASDCAVAFSSAATLVL